MREPTVSKSQFKAKALEYFRRVEASGQRLVVTDHGRPTLELRRYRGAERDPLDFSRDAGVSLSTAQRLLGGAVGPSTDTLDRVADVFGLLPYQLLIPGLEPTRPSAYRVAADAPMPTRPRVRRISLRRQA